MNRENISATKRTGRPTASGCKAHPGYHPKELCVIWIPERKSYLQGVTPHALYTIAEPDRALVLEGDRATDLAERVIAYHGAKAVLRTHYRQAQ